MKITAEMFIKATGYAPQHDDLDRCNCTRAGDIGHWSCGWCEEHNKPRFVCGCIHKLASPFVIFNETTHDFVKFETTDRGIGFIEAVQSLDEATVIPFGHKKEYYIRELIKFSSLENCKLTTFDVTISMNAKDWRKVKELCHKPQAIEKYGAQVVDDAESAYETDFDKYFWQDLDAQERDGYFKRCEKAREAINCDETFKEFRLDLPTE